MLKTGCASCSTRSTTTRSACSGPTTAFTQPEDQRRALRAGFKHFVPRPVEVDALADVVRTVVDGRAREAS